MGKKRYFVITSVFTKMFVISSHYVTIQPCGALLPATHKFQRQRFGEKGNESFFFFEGSTILEE